MHAVCSIALAVFTRSPSAYEALKGFNLLQLPSVRTLKHYIDGNLEEAGDSMERLKIERKKYLEMVEQKATGKLKQNIIIIAQNVIINIIL